MSADNRHFDMTATPLEPSLEIAFGASPNGASHWKVDNNRLIFAWHGLDEGFIPFPSRITAHQAVEVVTDWLKSADYGPEPDHDGDNQHSWRIYCEDWGIIRPYLYSFVAIEPAWAMYGK